MQRFWEKDNAKIDVLIKTNVTVKEKFKSVGFVMTSHEQMNDK